jgi:gluconolactonase
VIFCQDTLLPEGPVCLPDGSWLFTEMRRGTVCHLSADAASRHEVAKTGRPSGLALASNGSVWVAESGNPALLSLRLDGRVSVITEGPPEAPFLWPNDLCVGPDGAIYMTDSGCHVHEMDDIAEPADFYDVPVNGRVFRIDPKGGACEVLDSGLRFTNGIACDPRGTGLYVAETLTGNIYNYDLARGDRRLFANVMLRAPIEHGQVAGPDGMAFGRDGRLYVAVLVQGDITVLNRDGSLHARLEIDGSFPTNVAFGPPGVKTLLVTEGSNDRLLLLDVETDGAPLFR